VSKQAVRDALKTFSSERVGLVVYAGSATILCPLTYDYDFVLYMLEQAHTRSADFGGTTVQAAVEKVVDQVFMADRGGVQDLVILTDGGDYGSQMPRVAELLKEYDVDLLLLGIGNPNEGAPIPLVDAEGVRTLLRSQDAIVYTQLEDATLRDLVAQSTDAVYVPVGLGVFDLGQIYAEYVEGREVVASEGAAGLMVYQEAALFFMIPALVLLLLSEFWGAKGLQLGKVAVLLGALVCMPDVEANVSEQFTEAAKLYKDGAFVEAELLFAGVAKSGATTSLTTDDLAVVQLNRGLCLMALSKVQSETSSQSGLSYAQQAQLAFLAAKRYAPQMQRSGVQLESTAVWVAELQLLIDAEADEQEAQEAQMQQLIERLQALLEAQQTLLQQVGGSDVEPSEPKLADGASAPEPIPEPGDAGASAAVLTTQQTILKAEAEAIHLVMQQLDARMVPPPEAGLPPLASILEEPLALMTKVPEAMGRAIDLLVVRSSWPTAQAEQLNAEKHIEEIIQLLSNDSSDEPEGDEWDEMEEDGEYEYSDEMDESMPSSMPMDGDFSAGGEMQALPLPNYSAEDILLEEQGNLQFRQQQRANANAAQVERDY
jgi:hypothetical protein